MLSFLLCGRPQFVWSRALLRSCLDLCTRSCPQATPARSIGTKERGAGPRCCLQTCQTESTLTSHSQSVPLNNAHTQHRPFFFCTSAAYLVVLAAQRSVSWFVVKRRSGSHFSTENFRPSESSEADFSVRYEKLPSHIWHGTGKSRTPQVGVKLPYLGESAQPGQADRSFVRTGACGDERVPAPVVAGGRQMRCCPLQSLSSSQDGR